MPSSPKKKSGQSAEAQPKKRRRTTTPKSKSSTDTKGTSSLPPAKKKAGAKKSSSPPKKQAIAPVPPSITPTRTLIIDNGGDTVKFGWSTDDTPRCIPNASARLPYQLSILVGDELNKVQNPNSLIGVTRSTERGMITDLGNQTQVWKRMLDLLGVVIPLTTEAAQSLGWKAVSKKSSAASSKTNDSSSPTSTNIPSTTIAVMLLLPPHCPRGLLDQILQVWLDDFGVARVGLGISSVCATQEHPSLCTSTVVDLGWSQTTIIPTFRKIPITTTGASSSSSIRRLPIGARHMINMLKYYMSYRQYNLMEQDVLIRDVLEKLCYLSLDLRADLALARRLPSGRREYDRDYVLPDYQTSFAGSVRIPLALERQRELDAKQKAGGNQDEDDDDDDEEDDEDVKTDDEEEEDDDDSDDGSDKEVKPKKRGRQEEKEDDEDDEEEESAEQARRRIMKQRAEEERKKRLQEEEEQLLRVSVERFTVPEVLFRPFDSGLTMDLVGLPRAIVQAISACPAPYQPALYQSIYVTGGLSQLTNLKQRLEEEVRALMPNDYELNIQLAKTPTERAWIGAKEWVTKASFSEWSIGREEWTAASGRKVYTRLLVANGKGSYV